MKMKLKKNIFLFIFIFIIILILILILSLQKYLNNKQENMTTVTGTMLGHIERKIHPITRPIVRKVKASFSNPTLEYYNNKLYQIFK